jgi:phosphotriesterase-related protein
MSTVDTLDGPVDSSSVGATLMHEHIFAVSAALAADRPDFAFPDGRDAAIERIAALLREVKTAGIDTIVDLTVFGHDRDIPALREAAADSGLTIVLATGFYTDDEPSKTWATRERIAKRLGEPSFAERVMHADVTQGIGASGPRAGIIKVVSDTAHLTEHGEVLFRAAARVSAETGVPLSTHSHAAVKNGMDQIHFLTSCGADPQRIIIGHCGDTTDLDYLRRLLEHGVTIASDRFGFYLEGTPTMDERVAVIAGLCRQGYAGQIVVAHDTMMHTDWLPPGYADAHFPQWVPTHISTDVLPALRAAGVAENDLDAIMTLNPARLLGRSS